MSTISKLNPEVRRQRTARRAQLNSMRADLGTLGKIVAEGRRIANSADFPRYTNAAKFNHERMLKDMSMREVVMRLVYKQVRKICLDPSRTGATKEAILNKLGGVPAPAEPSRLVLPAKIPTKVIKP